MFKASKPPCGIENGLWQNAIFPVSSNSYIGKSTIQQNLYIFSSIKFNLFPSSVLIRPASSVAFGLLSAIKNIVSSFSRLANSRSSDFNSSGMNLSIGPLKDKSSCTSKYPRPPIPIDIAYSSIFSWNPLDKCPFTFIALTVLSIKGLKVHFLKKSDKSIMNNGFLKSGLSLPYFNIASLYGILGKGYSATFLSENLVNVLYTTGSITLKTSSCVLYAISISN